jgi:hypothetical protein
MSEKKEVVKKQPSQAQLDARAKFASMKKNEAAAKAASLPPSVEEIDVLDYDPNEQPQEVQPYNPKTTNDFYEQMESRRPLIQSTPKQPAKPTTKYDQKKRYHFQLMKTHESAKGRDMETGEILDNPFPPIYFIEPSGQGINPETGETENWRYLAGYPSIWVKDQMKPEPSDAQLANPKNFIEFRNGSLFVSGMNTALLDAIMIQDIFEEVKNPLNQLSPVYRLVNPEKEIKQIRSVSDMRYEASKAAREATVAQMLPIAMHFGIDVGKPEEDLYRIRNEFILRAESDPDNFNKQFTNPKNTFKYKITLALRGNLISTSVIPGKMVLTSTQRAYFDVKEGDVAEQFAQLVFNRVDEAVKLYHLIENLLS